MLKSTSAFEIAVLSIYTFEETFIIYERFCHLHRSQTVGFRIKMWCFIDLFLFQVSMLGKVRIRVQWNPRCLSETYRSIFLQQRPNLNDLFSCCYN